MNLANDTPGEFEKPADALPKPSAWPFQMKKLHILAIATGHEAHALRAAAECWGADVSVSWVGHSAHVVDYLSSRPAHELIIISGHGDSSGLLMPELHESVRHKYPYDKRITPDQFRAFVKLSGSTIVNLSCETGREPLANAFLACGAQGYIGPMGSPDGSATLMYALQFLYAFIVNEASVADAHHAAASQADDRSMFKMWGIERDPSTTRGQPRR